MNGKQWLILCGLVLGSSACMGQTRPAPDTAAMPSSASIAEQAGTEARRLEAERRSGVIFETSGSREILTDGQAPVPEMPAKEGPAQESKAKEGKKADEASEEDLSGEVLPEDGLPEKASSGEASPENGTGETQEEQK